MSWNTTPFQVEVFWVMTPCSVVVKVARPFEALVTYHNTTRPHNPEDLDLNLHRGENSNLALFPVIDVLLASNRWRMTSVNTRFCGVMYLSNRYFTVNFKHKNGCSFCLFYMVLTTFCCC